MASRILCSIEHCDKPVLCKSMCRKHYYECRSAPACAVPECKRNAVAKGYCPSHYARFVRNGDPCGGATPTGACLRWLKSHASYLGNDCLRWPYAYRPNGYAFIQISNRTRTASNVMCRLAHGDPPTEVHEAAHTCGKGDQGCLNPNHLYWATRSENHADAIRHGTHPGLQNKGESHPLSKLTDAVVREIRARAAAGERQADLKREYGLKGSTVSLLVNRKSWNHI